MSVDAHVCGNCGSSEIASVDVYEGTCVGAVIGGDQWYPDFEPGGYTEIAWDSCEQVGWCCTDCGKTVRDDARAWARKDAVARAAYLHVALYSLTAPAARSAV